jgi:c(7)-type cytochrome triheme protein
MRGLALLVAVLAGAAPAGSAAQGALVSSYAADELHGRVVLDNFSSTVRMPAVTFDHWRHRAMYTCRVCHVDLGFALEAGETRVSAGSNQAGQHCGACHDGKREYAGRAILRSCSGWPHADAARGCTLCHTGPDSGPGRGYAQFKKGMPLDSADYIDWALVAQRGGLITPIDFLEGISEQHSAMKIDRNVTIQAKGTWLESVTFSHRKHAQWNGCELCHPEVFPVTQRGAVKYDMNAIRGGQYCGVCHANVAFPLDACKRCHGNTSRPAMR